MTRGGKHFYITFIDDYSRYTKILPLDLLSKTYTIIHACDAAPHVLQWILSLGLRRCRSPLQPNKWKAKHIREFWVKPRICSRVERSQFCANS
uniref:Uncharacterized protein n=1 Tax=Vitis vinifera TaxID=29760 RepID=F6H950_VITVI